MKSRSKTYSEARQRLHASTSVVGFFVRERAHGALAAARESSEEEPPVARAISRVTPDGDLTGPAWARTPTPRLNIRTPARIRERVLPTALETRSPNSMFVT